MADPVLVRLRPPPEWPTLGWEVVDWVEAYLCHGPGDVMGDPIVWDDEIVGWFCDLYRLYPPGHAREGRRVVNTAVISRLKGRSKSEVAGAATCAEALGPVRFAGWDARGNPVGKPVANPFCRILATEEGQTGNTYDNVTVMLDHAATEHPQEFSGIDLGRNPQGSTRIFIAGGGEIRPSTASASAKDGGKETFAVADEPHLYTLPEHRTMHRMVRRNLAKRRAAQGWMLNTTTAYVPGEGSVAEELAGHAERELAAEEKGKRRDYGFLYDHREAPAVADWASDEEVRAALVASAGPFAEVLDLDRVMEQEVRGPDADRYDLERYWLNQVSQGAQHAWDTVLWRRPLEEGGLCDPAASIPEGDSISIGFDGAKFHDATAAIATHIASGLQVPLGIWEVPPNATADYEIDTAAVDATLQEAWERWRVVRLYADPPYWEELVDSWVARWGSTKVVKWWTNRDRQMAFAVLAYTTAQRSGSLTHDGDADFARHHANARRRATRVKDDDGKYLWTVRKEHPTSPRKIDAAVAGVLSWEARGDAIADGALKEKRRPVGHSF